MTALTADASDGGDQLRALAKKLKGADKAYRKELRIGLLRAAKPLREAAKADMDKYLPSGYVRTFRRAYRPKTMVRLAPKTASLWLTASGKGKPRPRHVGTINKGVLRHPVYGNRKAWVDQKIRAGWWTDPLRAGLPGVRRQIVRTISDVNDQLLKGS